jgi:AcrR family transcriptional regulator
MPKTTKRKRKSSTREKRRKILNAAVQVFAKKGFHRCRISDIASQAEVAYGLVYHYFKNKEEILNTIFDENWGLLVKLIENVGEQTDTLEGKLHLVVSLILDSYRMFPEIMQVIVMEIARSSKFLKKPKIEAFENTFSSLAEVFKQHQDSGEISKELDPKFLAYSFFGMVELIITGYLLGTLPHEEGEAYEAIKSRLVKMFLDGIKT